MSRTYTKKTPAERRQESRNLQEQLATQVEALSTSEGYMQFLDFVKGCTRYSFNNTMLINLQCPEATVVARQSLWWKNGYMPKKGEHGLSIFGHPVTKTIEADEEDPDSEEKSFTFFPIVKVFDVSQMQLKDPEGSDPVREHGTISNLEGADSEQVFERVKQYLEQDLKFKVIIEPTGSSAKGYTSHLNKRVVLAPDLSEASRAAVIVHEAAHAIMHEDNREYQEHRGICEVEAESVAYVVSGILGVDTAPVSVAYVNGWAKGDANKVKELGQRVHGAIQQLLEGVDAMHDPFEES